MGKLAGRWPEPNRHLDASLAPLENALLARAEELEHDDEPGVTAFGRRMAAEFRALAKELHHW